MNPLARYTLYQAPGWALAAALLAGLTEWFGLPAIAALLVLGVMILKDFLLYPVVRRAYHPARHGIASLVGEVGVAVEDLVPGGFIRVRGELWRAEASGSQAIPAGCSVRVHAARGMTLLVKPDAEAGSPPTGAECLRAS